MKISPSTAGFLKGLLIVVVLAVVSFLGDAAHLTGVLNPVLAALVAGVFSGIESKMKANTDGETGLFGAVSIKQY